MCTYSQPKKSMCNPPPPPNVYASGGINIAKSLKVEA